MYDLSKLKHPKKPKVKKQKTKPKSLYDLSNRKDKE